MNIECWQVIVTIERLSMTFTANGKQWKWNFCCLCSAVCKVEWNYLYLQWIVGDVIPFLCAFTILQFFCARADLYCKQVFYCTNMTNRFSTVQLYCYLDGIRCSWIIRRPTLLLFIVHYVCLVIWYKIYQSDS